MIDFANNPRWARGLLFVLLPLPIILTVVFSSVPVADNPSTANAAAAIALAIPVTVIYLRHGLATARGERPRGWRWTFVALCFLAYLPGPLFAWWNWPVLGLVVTASILMLFRGRMRVVLFVVACLYHPANELYLLWFAGVEDSLGIGVAFWVIYWLQGWAVPFVAYSAVLLVRRIDDLSNARTEYAHHAVRRERLRMSRDLHDLLGHNLTAITTKGELARRMLSDNASGARQQVSSVAAIATRTRRHIRTIAEASEPVSLHAEIADARDLLADAGVGGDFRVDVPDVPPATQDVLARAIREGVTNILRHSDARSATIVLSQTNGVAILEIVNDGVQTRSARGGGLTGIAQRAEEQGGTFRAGVEPYNRFRLHLSLPADRA